MWLFYTTGRIPVDLNTCLWEKPSMARRWWVFITGSSSICRRSTTMLITKATKQETTKTRSANAGYRTTNRRTDSLQILPLIQTNALISLLTILFLWMFCSLMKTTTSSTYSSAGRAWWSPSVAPSSAWVQSLRSLFSPSSSSCRLRRWRPWWSK